MLDQTYFINYNFLYCNKKQEVCSKIYPPYKIQIHPVLLLYQKQKTANVTYAQQNINPTSRSGVGLIFC